MLNIPFLSGTGKLSANFSITVFRVQRVSFHPLRITRSCLRQGDNFCTPFTAFWTSPGLFW